MKNINQKIGIVVRKQRLLTQISQERLGEATGLHRTYISDVERGKRNITIVSLYKIATALHISLSKLIEEAEKL